MSVRPRSSASKSNRRGSRPRRLPAHCFRVYHRLYHSLCRYGHTRTFTGASRPSRKSMSAVPSSLACYMHPYRQYRAPSHTPVAAQRFLGIAMARAKPVHIAVVELERPIVFDENVRPIRLNTDPMLVTSMEVATAQANAHEPASYRPAYTHADSAAQTCRQPWLRVLGWMAQGTTALD